MRLNYPFTLMVLALFSATFVHAAPERAKEAKPPTVDVIYTGTGAARFIEKYSRHASGVCAIISHTSEEGVSDVNWLVEWKKANPAVISNPKPTQAFFTGSNSRTDSEDCGGPEFVCVSALDIIDGGLPGSMIVTKSGKKGYILSLTGEQKTRGLFSDRAACMRSSVFDNAITEGMNSKQVTELKVQITPSTKKKKIVIPYTLVKTYDCTDPAKVASFFSNTCTIETGFKGLLTINGKWKAKLVN